MTTTDLATVPYTVTLPDGRSLFIELPEHETRRDRDGTLLLKPPAVRRLDKLRALAIKTPVAPSPGYLQSLRAALGLTQSQLAKRIGYSLPTIKRWEAGNLKPGKAAIAKLQSLAQRAARQGVVIAA